MSIDEKIRETIRERISERIRGVGRELTRELIREIVAYEHLPEYYKYARRMNKVVIQLVSTFTPQPGTMITMIQVASQAYALAYLCKYRNYCRPPPEVSYPLFVTLPTLPRDFLPALISYPSINMELRQLNITEDDVRQIMCNWMSDSLISVIRDRLAYNVASARELARDLILMWNGFSNIIGSRIITPRIIENFISEMGTYFGYFAYIIPAFCGIEPMKEVLKLLLSNDTIRNYIEGYAGNTLKALLEKIGGL